MNFKIKCSHWVVGECELADILVRRETEDLDCLLKIWGVEIEVVAWEGERRGGEEEWREEGKGREGERRGGEEEWREEGKGREGERRGGKGCEGREGIREVV